MRSKNTVKELEAGRRLAVQRVKEGSKKKDVAATNCTPVATESTRFTWK
jgi:hypothetical protein